MPAHQPITHSTGPRPSPQKRRLSIALSSAPLNLNKLSHVDVMTVGSMLARNHNVLAKACLGGGFAYGFAYTNTHGSSPLKDAAVTAGARDTPFPELSFGGVIVAFSFPYFFSPRKETLTRRFLLPLPRARPRGREPAAQQGCE